MGVPKGGMMKVKKFLLYLVFAALFVQNASATPVLFDFDDVLEPGTAAEIEEYMEDIYGSEITVINCVLGTNPTPVEDQLDSYIRLPDDLPEQWFAISFEQVPITAVSFDFFAADDSIQFYADGVEFSVKNPDCCAGSSGFIHFDTPVTTLLFETSSAVMILDNIVITNLLNNNYRIRNTHTDQQLPAVHNPEPATALLLGFGAMMLAVKKRNTKIGGKKVR